MFEISVKDHFSAAHHLVGYKGACANVHGHNWEVEIFLRGRRPNAIGMLVDFKRIRTEIHEVLARLDHQDLNRLPPFQRGNPTSENIARYLFRKLSARLNRRACKVRVVRVSESPGTAAAYFEEA